MVDSYFTVSKYPDSDKPTDIAFSPINKTLIPKEYLEFKSDVEAFVSTIKVLFNKDEVTRLQFLDEIYFASLLCFSGEKSDHITASQTLAEIKNKLTISYWSRARNEILKKYGIAAGVISLLLLVGNYFSNTKIEFYFISLIGTCSGSWLSLAIRTKQLKFDDIRQHISEVSSPYIRCFFACLLSLFFILLLKIGVIEIKLGGETSKNISLNLEIALIIGFILGFVEKLLISTINDKTKSIFS